MSYALTTIKDICLMLGVTLALAWLMDRWKLSKESLVTSVVGD